MYSSPYPPSKRQLETVWRDVLADPLTPTRYNVGLPTLGEMLDRRLPDGTVCVTVAPDWTIVNWAHDPTELPDISGKIAAWSGGWVSPAGRGPVLAQTRRFAHEAVVGFYRSIGIVIHGAAVVIGNLAGERHTRNIGYYPIGVAPDFAKVRRTSVAIRGEEEGELAAHSIWCWGEDNARFIWGLAMQRTRGPQVAFWDRELIKEIHLG